ncbi:PREDICTED: E3 ubiquitin-protein ligase RNF14-like [Chrysochloris asiatica]|uniref:E3 ubiquitin-protein ligase RNF14 n=1 Tax=Chrysochloris asiatica TaxID=185453 RepID=A0A9B0U5P1_CHRAS|nr:PREDICTED: E3 ubiquitin-protein ligase RNF14-like [Chrysochloris asiatica]
MASEDREAQEDELLALSSIYDGDEFKRSECTQGGESTIYLDLPENFMVFVSDNGADGLQNNGKEHMVCFLPPLVLSFELPSDYPSNSPPSFTLSGKWLSVTQLTALCKRLDNLWEKQRGSVVLFSWIQFLKEDTLTYLNINSPFELKFDSPENMERRIGPATLPEELSFAGATGFVEDQEQAVDKRAVRDIDIESLASLLQEVLDFDQTQQEKSFNKAAYTCNICFSIKLGSQCMCFSNCKHVYCKECMKSYFEIQIKDGRVNSLNCPEPKCSSMATPNQVKDLVPEDVFARYNQLLIHASLELMEDVVSCPRIVCQLPVVEEKKYRLGVCGGCSYAFCTLCRFAYHGISPCRMTPEKLMQLQKQYQRASENEKRMLEKKYGKRVIQMALDEMKSKKWLEMNSKRCPSCGSRIEKLDGCNKMTCTNCMQYFCWVCLQPLCATNPYKHFNDRTSPCFRL